MTLFIDDREPADIITCLEKSKHLDIEVRRLSIGDYVFNDILVERKTYYDFYQSVKKARLWSQLKRLKSTGKTVILLIEGWKSENVLDLIKGKLVIKFNYKASIGALASVLLHWHIPVVLLNSKTDTIQFLTQAYIKYGRGKSGRTPPPQVTVSEDPEEVRLAMLCCIRGIGPVLAGKILDKYSFLALQNISDGFLAQSVKGLGLKRAELLVKVFRGE